MTAVFDLKYTADWDGNWLTVVVEISSPIGGGLQSSRVLDPARVISEKNVRLTLLRNEFVPVTPEAKIERGSRFEVKKI